MAHSISAHLSAPCLSLCPPNKLMSGRGPEVKLREGVQRDPQPHRPGPETGSRPAKGKIRNGTRLRSDTGVECLGRWSSFADTCKKKVCVGGMKASRDGKMQASLTRGAKKFKEQTCHPSQRNFHLMRNSFQREDLRQRANLSRPHHSATLKLCSKMTYSNVFSV